MPRGKVHTLAIALGLLFGVPLCAVPIHAQAPEVEAVAAPSPAPSPAVPAPPLTAPPPVPPPAPLRAPAPRLDAGQQRVADSLRQLTDWVKGRGGSWSARIVDPDSGMIWAEAAPQAALNPASNMKVVTAAVALERLGEEFCFHTGLYGKQDGDRVESLVLRGDGDPSLVLPDLWELARALRSLGVTRVGQILVDQSRFDDQFVPPAFAQQPNEWASFRAPVSAVALERNTVTLNVVPTNPGEAARAWFEPAGVVSIEGTIETRRPGAGEAIQLSLETRGEQLIAKLGGYAPKSLPRLRFDRRLDDPRRAPGLALRELLIAAGIQVQGGVGLGGQQIDSRLVFHQSEPLGRLISELGKHSDNFYAEMLFKTLGADAGASPARSEDGARVVLQWLSEHGLASPDTRIENGSGLFDANRVSAALLAGVLVAARRNPAVYPEFLAQFAIGGVDGTLRSRFRKFKAERVVRAKTGTLAAAVGLTGYVLDGNQPPIAFSLLVNGLDGQAHAVRERMDRVVETIAEARKAH